MIILNKRFVKRAILVMAPFLFIACEKPNDQLGFNQVIGSTAGLGVIEFDSLITYTQEIDSLLVALDENQAGLGGYVGNRLVGSITDGYFGKSKASFVTEVQLNNFDPDFGTNPVVDSVFLIMRYSGYYGDTTQPIDLNVYELTSSLHPNGTVADADGNVVDSAYYSNYMPRYDAGQPIDKMGSFVPQPTKQRQLGNNRVAYVKIPLSLSYFQQKFADVGDGNFTPFSSNSEFEKYFKGIYVEAANDDGSILYFNLNTTLSGIEINFHNDEDSSAQTVGLNFLQGSAVPVSFNIFNNDYKNYPAGFDLENMNTSQGEPQTFIQAMGGVTTVIEVPGLQDLADSNILINSAVLTMRKKLGTGYGLAPPTALEIREFTEQGPGSALPDFTSAINGTKGGGAYQSEDLRDGLYEFNITRYVFNVVNTGETIKMAVVPVRKSVAANRVILQGGRSTPNPVSLKIYYTKP